MRIVISPMSAAHLLNESNALTSKPVIILGRKKNRVLQYDISRLTHDEHRHFSGILSSSTGSMTMTLCFLEETKTETALEPSTTFRSTIPGEPFISWKRRKSVT